MSLSAKFLTLAMCLSASAAASAACVDAGCSVEPDQTSLLQVKQSATLGSDRASAMQGSKTGGDLLKNWHKTLANLVAEASDAGDPVMLTAVGPTGTGKSSAEADILKKEDIDENDAKFLLPDDYVEKEDSFTKPILKFLIEKLGLCPRPISSGPFAALTNNLFGCRAPSSREEVGRAIAEIAASCRDTPKTGCRKFGEATGIYFGARNNGCKGVLAKDDRGCMGVLVRDLKTYCIAQKNFVFEVTGARLAAMVDNINWAFNPASAATAFPEVTEEDVKATPGMDVPEPPKKWKIIMASLGVDFPKILERTQERMTKTTFEFLQDPDSQPAPRFPSPDYLKHEIKSIYSNLKDVLGCVGSTEEACKAPKEFMNVDEYWIFDNDGSEPTLVTKITAENRSPEVIADALKVLRKWCPPGDAECGI